MATVLSIVSVSCYCNVTDTLQIPVSGHVTRARWLLVNDPQIEGALACGKSQLPDFQKPAVTLIFTALQAKDRRTRKKQVSVRK